MKVTPYSMIGWMLTLLLPLLVFYQLQQPLAYSGALLVALMTGAAVQWGFRLVPDFVTGLMVLLVCVLLGLAPVGLVFSGFTSSIFFLILGVFLLSALLTESVWMARLSHALLRISRNKPTNGLTALLLTAIALTMALPSPLGRSAILAPLLKPLATGRSTRFRTALVFAMTQGSTFWSTVFLTGNPLNFVLLGFLNMQTQQRFQWLYWFYAAFAVALVGGIGVALILAWLLRDNSSRADTDIAPIQLELPKVQARDGLVIGLYLGLFVAIFTRTIHHIPLHWVVMVLALIGYYGVPISLQAVRSKVDWPTLLFIASIVSWQPMLHYQGVDTWITKQLPFLLQYMQHSLLVNILLLSLFIGVVRLVAPGAPTFVILLSTLLPLSNSLGMPGWVLGFVLLTVSEGFLFPHQHGVLSHVLSEMQANNLDVDNRRLLLANALAWVLRVLAIVASIPLWQKLALI